MPRPSSRAHQHERLDLGLRRDRRRHDPSAVTAVEPDAVGREPDGPGRRARRDLSRMRVELVRRRRRAPTRVAHRPHAHWRVADVAAEVDGGAAALDAREVLGVRLERPVDAGLERRASACPRPRRACAAASPRLGRARRDREPAVAGHHAGDALVRRRRQPRVPQHLRVVVRVQVEETRRTSSNPTRRARAPRQVRRDLDDAPVAIPTSARTRRAPVPSTTIPRGSRRPATVT